MGADREGLALLLKVPDAAVRLGIGRSTLYELLATGELRCVRIGRAVRIPRSELEQFVARLAGDAETGQTA